MTLDMRRVDHLRQRYRDFIHVQECSPDVVGCETRRQLSRLSAEFPSELEGKRLLISHVLDRGSRFVPELFFVVDVVDYRIEWCNVRLIASGKWYKWESAG